MQSSNGFSLVEVIVATALVGFMAILMAGLDGAILHGEKKSADHSALDIFEINRITEIANHGKVQEHLASAKDPLLLECLQSYCSKNCLSGEWHPLAWDPIPINMIRAGTTMNNIGGGHILPSWKNCPVQQDTTESSDDKKVFEGDFFPATCMGRTRASWKNLGPGTIQILFEFSVKRANVPELKQDLSLYLGRGKATENCELAPSRATPCKGQTTNGESGGSTCGS